MSHEESPSNHNAISELLNDTVIVRLVTALNITSQSILELLEYGFTSKDVSRAMAKGVVEFEKPLGRNRTTSVIESGLEIGEYYHELVREKLRLAKLGLLILEIVESDLKMAARNGSEYPVPEHNTETLINSDVNQLFGHTR